MKKYTKPIVEVLSDTTEGIYAASGIVPEEDTKQEERKICRFGRKEANPGSDTCQACSFSGGVRSDELPGESLYKSDFKDCVDGMSLKK